MPKVSNWKVIATEGPTVDGRKITRDWLSQMAESYDLSEYTALIWPEHRRVYGFGENWGKVTELKAEENDKGVMQLFGKIEPNQYLLDANSKKQKLFTSIEPEPDYKGQGTCYLMGLAVTDSPASSGTSILQFSRKNGETTNLECSQLEEINLDECFTKSERFFSMCSQFFASGEDNQQNQPEDTDVTKEELTASLKEQLPQMFSTLKTELKDELKQEFAQQPQEPEASSEPEAPQVFTAEQFSTELEKQLKPLNEKVEGLEAKFAKLEEEAPGQRPNATGGGEDNKYSLI